MSSEPVIHSPKRTVVGVVHDGSTTVTPTVVASWGSKPHDGQTVPRHYTHPGILSTTVHPSTCPRCKAPTWQGVIEGFDTRLDPQFLNPRTELIARLHGRHIYQTIPGTNLPELQWRTVTHILAPPERQPARILATHTCTPPPHPPLEDIWPKRQAADLPEEPPF